jgi:cyanamide hydratase
MRVYYFGRAITRQHFPAFTYSPETYFLLCLLHDLGTVPAHRDATHLSFEFQGAMLAHAALLERGADPDQADAVAEAIIRHQDLGEVGTMTQLLAVVQLATVLDNVGANGELVARETIEEVVREWPRDGSVFPIFFPFLMGDVTCFSGSSSLLLCLWRTERKGKTGCWF